MTNTIAEIRIAPDNISGKFRIDRSNVILCTNSKAFLILTDRTIRAGSHRMWSCDGGACAVFIGHKFSYWWSSIRDKTLSPRRIRKVNVSPTGQKYYRESHTIMASSDNSYPSTFTWRNCYIVWLIQYHDILRQNFDVSCWKIIFHQEIFR